MRFSTLVLCSAFSCLSTACSIAGHGDEFHDHTDSGIHDIADADTADFDIVHARVTRDANALVFHMHVSGKAGETRPTARGTLASAEVFSYVWPTSLNSSVVGFEADQGILAFAVTAHADFDDTPLYDESGNGLKDDDGYLWHSHWVVLTPDDACGPGALKVKDIPPGQNPRVPSTWPGLPILIDSPDIPVTMDAASVAVRVPFSEAVELKDVRFDAVTAGLQVNANVHAPLLCVRDVFDIASNDLSLPGQVR